MSIISNIPRRVVTGYKSGKSCIIDDAPVKNVSEHMPGLIISDIWTTNTMPVELNNTIEIENSLFPNTPSNGSYFRYVVIPPDTELEKHIPQMKSNDIHPFMHKTNTLDYIIILSGELYLIVEDGETLLKAGDIVIQQGNNHAWSNRSDKPCIQLAILLDAEQTNY